MLRPLLAGFLAFAALAAPMAAAAQDDLSPRERFGRAVERFETLEYEGALEDFQRLYELTEESALLYNIARCHEEIGSIPEAIEALEAYLDSVESGPDREDALRRLVELERRRNATPAEVAPVPEPQVDPEREVEPHQEGGLSTLSAAGIGLLAAGGAGLIVGAVLGGLAISEHDQLASSCAPMCEDAQLSGMRGLALGTDVSLVVGGVAAAAGVVLLVLGLNAGDESASVRLRGAGVEGSF